MHVLSTFMALSVLASFAVLLLVTRHAARQRLETERSAVNATTSNPVFSTSACGREKSSSHLYGVPLSGRGEAAPLLHGARAARTGKGNTGNTSKTSAGAGGAGQGRVPVLAASGYGKGGNGAGLASSQSLLTSEQVPLWVRICFPVCLFLNTTLFAFANTATGASVVPVLTVGDENPIWMQPLFSFDLANSIKDMWLAGVSRNS